MKAALSGAALFAAAAAASELAYTVPAQMAEMGTPDDGLRHQSSL